MIRSLLIRGMLVGMIAGVLVFCFARWLGEPEVDRAIAVEAGIDQSRGEAPEPMLVSRKTQRGLGLFTGTVLYGVAIGGIFGLVYAYAQGRYVVSEPRQLAALIAGFGYVAIVIVPALKYPGNPPSVGNPETIGLRTAAYFLLIALSIATLTVSIQLYRRFALRFGSWNAVLLSGAQYVVLVAVLYRIFPNIDEVPSAFPASLLWQFRIASLELQAVLWGSLGVGFGWLTNRSRFSYGS
jgi:predicted cobalt transporter CbtA